MFRGGQRQRGDAELRGCRGRAVACLNGSRSGSTQSMAEDEPACGAHAKVAGWR
jgi:hypothetical protein